MLRTRNARGESFWQMQPEAAAQQQNYPPYMMPSLDRTFQSSKKVTQQLAVANAALRGQIARLTSSWEREKNKLVEDRDVLVARRELDKMAKTMEQSTVRQRALDTENERMALDIEAKNRDIVKLSAHLRRQEAKNQELGAQILQSNDASQGRITALHQRLRSQQEDSEKEAALQRQIRDAEERGLTMQRDYERRVSRMKEEVCLLILQNKELQELALMSNRDKARRKKEEKKAKREEEKIQKRERKEKEQEKGNMKREREEERGKDEKKEKKTN